MSKKKVCVVTGTRAEYGLLFPLMKRVQASTLLELQLIASTMHMSEEFGSTYKQIEEDGFVIDEKVENLLSPDSNSAIVKSTGLAMILLSDAFQRLQPDILLILGDRYETHAAGTAAMLMNIPIAHVHGGEITEGAVDEHIRHSLTKMSYLHFTSTQEYRQRIIQMGEDADRVFNSGAPGIDNILNSDLIAKDILQKNLSWEFGKKSALFTYHPVTLDARNTSEDIDNILDVLAVSGLNILCTYANSDNEGRLINQKIEAFCQKNPTKYKVVKSLGQLRYLSAMKYVDLLIGNTSSGIIEAASFNKPVVNIGDRQKGRLQSGNVLDCKIKDLDIAIEEAMSQGFYDKCMGIENIYGNGSSAELIISTIEKVQFSRTKVFVDIQEDMFNV